MRIEEAKDIEIVERGLRLVREIESCGYTACIAGGCVRDLVRWQISLSPEPDIHDVDIATNMPMEALKGHFRCASNNGEAHGTILVLFEDVPYEVTQYRADGKYTDGRHPDSVEWADTFEEDSRRRDFTMNAMGLDSEYNVLDYHGGEESIRFGEVATVGDPIERFNEDALRIIRAYRFASRFGMSISPVTSAACMALAGRVAHLTPERLHDEFSKTASYGVKAFSEFISYLAEGVGQYVCKDIDWKTLATQIHRVRTSQMLPWVPEYALALLFDTEEQMRDFRCSLDEIKALKFIHSYYPRYLAGELDLVDFVDGTNDRRWDALTAYAISRQGFFVLRPDEESRFRSFIRRYPTPGDISKELEESGVASGKQFGEYLRETRKLAYREMLARKEIDEEGLHKLVVEARRQVDSRCTQSSVSSSGSSE